MPYVGTGRVDKKLQELRERQASRRSEVAAANKREEIKLTAFLGKLDNKHDKDMININTKLHVTKIDLVREIQKDASPKLLQQVQKGSNYSHSKAPPNVQKKNAKFGAMKIPSQLTRQSANDKSPIPKIYPFHLIKSQNGNPSKKAEMKKKRHLPQISPRQFPILAAKYYRESQINTGKVQSKAHEGLLANETIKKLVMENRDDTSKRLQPLQNDAAGESCSLPPVSLLDANLNRSFPPPHNSPRNRLNMTEISCSATATDPSDEELQKLRSGQYFLRYSTALGDKTNHDSEFNETRSEMEPLENEAESEAMVSPHFSRGKLHIDNALTLVEDHNKPKEM